jgi:formylglycine-generating enzyme required for sulfatase activity
MVVTSGFWLGQFPVTQGEYEAVMGSRPSQFTACPPLRTGEPDRAMSMAILLDRTWSRLPVEQVSWAEAEAFCHKLTQREFEEGRLPAGFRYTLPTEAQWEYGCRAGTLGDRYGPIAEIAWFDQTATAEQTYPVGCKAPNAWGLHDMLGNVWEWCADWYEERLPGGRVSDHRGPSSGSLRVRRGGSWFYVADYCRSTYRCWISPVARFDNLGFRLALSSVQA